MRRLAVLVVALALVLPSGIVVARVTDADIARLQAEIDALNVRVSALEGATPAPTATPTPTPTPTPAPSSTPTPTPSPTPTPAPTGWTLRLREDFTTPAAEGQFEAVYWPEIGCYPYGWLDSSKNGVYDPSIISVHDGLMDTFIRTTSGVHRVASCGPYIDGSPNQLYGRYEIRFRADSIHGYKGAWLLWPQSEQWPRDGEIDFPEGDFDRVIEAYMHRQGATTGGDQDGYVTSAVWTDWHTGVTEWTPTAVRFYLDGTLVGTSTSRIPNTPMRWQIQNETTLFGFLPADDVSGHVLIDYLAVWAYTP